MLNNSNFKILILIIFILILIVFLYFGLQNELIVTNYEIIDRRVEESFTIALVTDTHSCDFGENQEELMTNLDAINPDLVILSGDIVDDVLPFEVGFETIELIKDKYPSYYVSGNHEMWSNEIDYIKERIKSMGVPVLDGKIKSLDIKSNKINILGIDDPDIGDGEYQKQLGDLSEFKSDQINFLLAHRPERYDDYRELDVDYVFSGHGHGGQWRIPIILENGLFAPNQGLFPKYTKGVHDFGDFKMIISRGLSRESTRIPRFYNKPEIVNIEFKNK